MAKIIENMTLGGTGEIAGSVTASACPTVSCRYVKLKAARSNAGNVYVGTNSAQTIAAGTTTVTAGFELDAGEETDWLPVENLNMLYRICDNAGDDLFYMVLVS